MQTSENKNNRERRDWLRWAALCARIALGARSFPALPTASDSTVDETLAMEIFQALYVVPRK
jgi:hypothetical protein